MTVTRKSPEAAGPPAQRSKWLVLLAACLGNLVLTLDSGIMGVSYPALAEAFATDTSTGLWVSVAFWVTGVGMVMTVGWLGDVGGRRFSYTLGFVLFSAALALCAISTDLWQLIGSRIFMGVGSSMVLAGVNAIILDRFEPESRAKAIGIAGAVVGLGLTAGPLAGGWLLDALGWQALFYMRIPLSLFAAALSWWALDSRGSGEREIAVDWLGAVALFSALASFLVVVNRSAEDGPLSPLVLASAALLAVSIPALIASQRRSARPILDFGLFRRAGYGLGLGVLVFHYTSLGAILLLAPFFFIDALGFSATKMGLFIMLHTLMRVFLAPVSGALTHRVGAWTLSGLGLAAMVCSLAWLSALAASGSSELAILGALLLAGVGSALYEPPNTTTIMGSVPADRYGTASASIASGRQLAFSVGVAAAGAIFAVRERAYLGALETAERAVALGFSDALLAGATLAGLGVLVSIAAIVVTRRGTRPE